MADLDKKNSSTTVRIVGADNITGAETNFADVTGEGEIKISSFANVDFQDSTKTITTTQSLLAVGVSNLANRKSVALFNKGAQTVYYGTTGVTSSTGIAVEKDEFLELAIGDNIDVYLVTGSASASVVIQEFA